VRDGNTIRRLDHPEQPLAGDAAVLAAAKPAQIVVVFWAPLRRPRNARQVVEDHRQFGVEQEADQFRQQAFHRLDLIHQSIHGGQQPIMLFWRGRPSASR
jgi:hypothetical protein